MASKLGADCPVFIENKPVLAKGIGNEFFPIDLSLSKLWLQIVIPSIHVPTAHAYSNIKPAQPANSLNELVAQPIEGWKATIKNDFEFSVFKRHPEIAAIKDQMYENGALYAAMSGSGSSVFGLFQAPPKTKWNNSYVIHTEQL
jgi:4-diphosphocytidyl-2-C-methyl-D-erythritol kinase